MSFIQTAEELEISKIKNVEIISSFSITNNDSKNSDIIAIAVYYDSGKQLCYSELDAPFAYFYSTVRRLYEEQKENIDIDKETKYLLETDYKPIDLKNIKEQYGTELKTVIPISNDINADIRIIKYIYERILSFLNRKVTVQSIKGLGKNFTLKYIEDGLTEQTYFVSLNDENKRKYIFPGIFEGKKELVIMIDNNNPLNITFASKDEIFYGSIKINDKVGTITESVYINGTLTYMNTDKLEIIENTPYDNILNKLNINGTKYLLPWGNIRIYAHKETKEKNAQIIDTISSIDILENGNIRITTNNTERLIIEKFKNVQGKINLKSIDETWITDIYFIGEDERYLILETTFLPSILARGVYKSSLAGRIFYKTYKASELNLESIDLDLTDVKRYQLMNESELKLIKRRGEE